MTPSPDAITALRDLADELMAEAERLFEMPELPAWWTPDRTKALNYGKSTALVSVSNSLRKHLKTLTAEHEALKAELAIYKPVDRADVGGTL